MDDVTAIVLTFNQKEMTLQCLASLLATEKTPFNVLLWDNGSHDDTAESVRDDDPNPNILVHKNGGNLGFAGVATQRPSWQLPPFLPKYLLLFSSNLLVELGNFNRLSARSGRYAPLPRPGS